MKPMRSSLKRRLRIAKKLREKARWERLRRLRIEQLAKKEKSDPS